MFAAVFSVLLVAAASLGDYADAVRGDLVARMREVLGAHASTNRIEGVVSFATDDFAFLQNETGAIKIMLDGRKSLGAGERIAVAGRPSLEGGRIVFVAEAIERRGRADLPPPVSATQSSLLFVATRPEERVRDINGRRVELTGRALGLTESGFALDVNSIPVTVVCAKTPLFLRVCEQTHPQVRIVGVPELVLDQAALLDGPRRVLGVKFHLASSDDIQLVPDLRYRINCRELGVMVAVYGVIALLAALLVVLLFFFMRQSRRQLRTTTLMAERKRMADDLHDTIEQHLVGAGMLLQLGKTEESRTILLRAKREMRDIVWGLKNDDMMRLTPTEMIKEYAKSEMRKGICRVSTQLAGLPEHLEAAQMRDLSLIIREAVGNAIKHGQAKKVAIACDPHGEKGGWLLRIANDGVPFDPAGAPGPAEGHFGVEGMKARARRLNAEMTLSVKNGWTIVSLLRAES